MSLRAAVLRARAADPLSSGGSSSSAFDDAWCEGGAGEAKDGPEKVAEQQVATDQVIRDRTVATSKFLMRRVSEPLLRNDSILKANPFPEISWWADPLRTGILHKLEGLRMLRPFRILSTCSGFGFNL